MKDKEDVILLLEQLTEAIKNAVAIDWNRIHIEINNDIIIVDLGDEYMHFESTGWQDVKINIAWLNKKREKIK